VSFYEVTGSWRAAGDDLSLARLPRVGHNWFEYCKGMATRTWKLLPVRSTALRRAGVPDGGLFRATARYAAQDFMYFRGRVHKADGWSWIGCRPLPEIPRLRRFDARALRHSDPRRANTGLARYLQLRTPEVRNYLSPTPCLVDNTTSTACAVDAVPDALLGLQQTRGEWLPNEFGGRENLPHQLIKQVQRGKRTSSTGGLTIAEESTAGLALCGRPTWAAWDSASKEHGWMNEVRSCDTIHPPQISSRRS